MPDIDTPKSHSDRRLAYLALLGCTIGVGAVTFALSFVGLRDYAERVAGFHHTLSWLVPVGVDGLTLCAVAATMILRHAHWRVRLYAWCAFAVAVAASVAGNLSHAQAQDLTWQGQIGAGAWPVFLALSSHLVIVVRRNMERARLRDTPDRSAQVKPRPATESAAGPAAAADSDTSPRGARPRKRQRSGGRDNDLTRQRARDAFRRGSTDLSAIAKRLGVSKRSVERYTADLRQPGSPATADATSDDKETEAVAA